MFEWWNQCSAAVETSVRILVNCCWPYLQFTPHTTSSRDRMMLLLMVLDTASWLIVHFVARGNVAISVGIEPLRSRVTATVTIHAA